jgi:hypothetical protein
MSTCMRITLALSLFLTSCVDAGCNKKVQSNILFPPANSCQNINAITIGQLLKNRKPLANKQLVILIDGTRKKIVTTNQDGVWSFVINTPLNNGNHLLEAQLFKSPNVTASAHLCIDTTRSSEYKITRSGNVNLSNSSIISPTNNDYTNTSTPTIIGLLRDASLNPVAGESVDIYVNSALKNTATSDSNGIFSYTLTSGQALSDGAHTTYAYCQQSNITLATNSFTVDTIAPDAPIITTPVDLATITAEPFTVAGTSEANNIITLFVDGNTEDVILADNNGDWSTDISGLSNGEHELSAYAEDEAYNVSALSERIDITIDI